MINHGHWLINGRRVDIASYQVRPEDVITIRPDSAPPTPFGRRPS